MGGFAGLFKGLGQSAEKRAISRALTHFAKGEVAKAIDVLKEAHARTPEDTEILFELVPLLTIAGRGTEAGEALRKILRRDPNSVQRISESIEQIKARRANVSPLHDALAEHFVRRSDLKRAMESLLRISPDDLKPLMARHGTRWESVRKSAPDAKLTKPSLHSAYYLALAHEQLRDYGPAGEIYRAVARNNPEELDRVLERFQSLLARDYQNVALRVAVADLSLQAGHEEEAAQHFQTALDTDARSAPLIVDSLAAFLADKDDRPSLRWILSLAYRACGSIDGALEGMRRLIDSDAHLPQVSEVLGEMASREDGRAARRLLADAMIRRKQYPSALEHLLHISEEEGLTSIREPLEALAAAQPQASRTHLLLSDIHVAEGRVDDSVACMRRAREAAPAEDSLLIPKITRILESHPDSADAHLLLADMKIAAGERERGIVVLRHLVHEAPEGAAAALERLTDLGKQEGGGPRARIGAAEACLALQRYDLALEHLDSVAASSPDLTPEFLHTVGLLAEAAPELYPGVGDLLRTLEPRSTHPHAVRFALGEAAFFGGDPVASTAAFREVLAAAPERTEEVRAALERFDRNDSRAVEAPYLLALIYLDRNEHDAALMELSRGAAANATLLDRILAKYEEILSAAPDDPSARCGFIQALLLGRRYDQVLAAGEETLKRIDDPRTARVTLAMGDALHEKGERDDAAKRYFAAYSRDRGLVAEIADRLHQLIDGEGSHSLASLALGKMMAAEGRSAEAREALLAASNAEPKLRDSVLTELRSLMATCPGDPENGLTAIKLLLDVHDLHQALQIASALLDDHPEHAAHLVGSLEAIVKERPDHAMAHLELGRALQRLGFHAKAAGALLNAFRKDNALAPQIQKRLQESLRAAPSTAEPYLASSAIHATRGKLQAAAELLSRALEKTPGLAGRLLPRLEEIWKQARGNGRIALIVADACLRAGKHDRAVAAFNEAAQRDPDLLGAVERGLEGILSACPEMGEAFLARARTLAQRLRVDAARSDLDQAFRLTPHLLPDILAVTEDLRSRAPESAACALLLADLYIAARKETEATRVLLEESDRERSPAERLPIAIRLWRLALVQRDDDRAREHLEEATRLAPDRNQFLARVHQVEVNALTAEASLMRKRFEDGSRRTSDLERALKALIELGDVEEAAAELDRNAEVFPTDVSLRLRAELALRRGDYPRAFENLKPLGPSTVLAFGAERAGDRALAAQTLEILSAGNEDPDLRVSLERVYRAMVGADLMGGSQRLLGETIVTFREGKAV
jgi:tetratricopeptide (TPR) repeat protein